MLTVYRLSNGQLEPCGGEVKGDEVRPLPDSQQLSGAVWIDLFEPTREEETLVEAHWGINIPTSQEIVGLEMANRIYEEDQAIFAPTSVLVGIAADKPSLTTVFLILKQGVLVTVRYSPIRAFETFAGQACRPAAPRYADGFEVCVGLLEAIIDRLADALGQAGTTLDIMTQHIFEEEKRFRKAELRDFRSVLRRLGRKGDMLSKARESLVSLSRISTFLAANVDNDQNRRELRARLTSVTSDIHALTDHISYLTGRISLLLDATVGLINMEQNGIIKIFSVASVVFLPPTLVASLYGMNFKYMPELDWHLGYPWAIGLMIMSAVLPYLFFKSKGWL